MFMTGEQVRIWSEIVVAYLNVQLQTLPVEFEENHWKCQSG